MVAVETYIHDHKKIIIHNPFHKSARLARSGDYGTIANRALVTETSQAEISGEINSSYTELHTKVEEAFPAP